MQVLCRLFGPTLLSLAYMLKSDTAGTQTHRQYCTAGMTYSSSLTSDSLKYTLSHIFWLWHF